MGTKYEFVISWNTFDRQVDYSFLLKELNTFFTKYIDRISIICNMKSIIRLKRGLFWYYPLILIDWLINNVKTKTFIDSMTDLLTSFFYWN